MLHQIMGTSRSKTEALSETAKTELRNLFRLNYFSYNSFEGNKHTRKGNDLEDQAINAISLKMALSLKKNTERRENDCISGECDIYVPSRNLIIDAKCSWSIGTHPFFSDEAAQKVKKSGYDIQVQGYMWLWDCDQAHIDFVLLPTPEELLSFGDDSFQHVDLVNRIPLNKRITTVVVRRDEKVIEKIKQQVDLVREYYQLLEKEYDELDGL